MRCPNCGHENREIARFCQHCGASLIGTAPGETETEAAGEAWEGQEGQMVPIEAATEATSEQPTAELDLPVVPLDAGADKGPQVLEEETAREELGSLEPMPAEEETVPALDDRELPEAGAEEDTIAPVFQRALHGAETLRVKEADGAVEEEMDTLATTEQDVAPEVLEESPAESAQGGEPLPDQVEPGEAEPASEPIPEPGVEPFPVAEPADGEPAQGKEDWAEALPAHPEAELWLEREEPQDVQELADAGFLSWTADQGSADVHELGTVVNGRYQVTEVLDEQDQEVLYRVRDLQRCAKCGFTGNSAAEAFCASCGAAMDERPEATMLQGPLEQREREVEVEVEAEDQFEAEGLYYWVWREAKKTGPLGGAEEPMRFVIGQRSHTGQVRELDEDSMLALALTYTRESLIGQTGLFVVADGMGGHEAGEVASQVAIEAFSDILMQTVLTSQLTQGDLGDEEIKAFMLRAAEAANDQVYLERQKRENDMGTTITAALVRDWTLYLAHVGDCRAYRWGEDGLQQLTTDHSIVASMIAAGAAQPEEIYTHPQRSVIYRCIGDRPTVDVDISTLSLSPGDRLVLCCDGLWEMVREEGIEDVMLSESDPQRACDVLVERANLAGGVDNISVIVVQL